MSTLWKIAMVAGVAYTGYQIYKAIMPAPLEGGDKSAPETNLVGYNPATSAPSVFGAGSVWRSATQTSYNPYAPQFQWAPTSNGYGWNGGFTPVPR